MKPLYILTDANGHTTCIAAEPLVIFDEFKRARMVRPLTVAHWVRNGVTDKQGWKKVGEFVWGGEDVGV